MAIPWGIIALVTCSIVIVTFFVYRGIQKKKNQTNTGAEDSDDESDTQVCEVLFFYTTWCPYCKKAMPEWEKFKEQWNGKTKNGYSIVMKEIDCDTNDTTAAKYEVVGYPTIKLIKDNKITDYDAKPNLDTLNQFLDSCF
jgi:endoplasmic reticulum resident protein 44